MAIFRSIEKNKVKTGKLNYFQVAWQACAMLALSILLAFAINQLRSDRLPLVGDWSIKAKLKTADGGRLEISFAEAEKLFMEKSALFIDARSMDDYASGHILGARSLPWHDVDQQFIEVTEDISPDTPIITYCDGVTCELSCDLALFLLDMGFNNVRVLLNGWAIWLESRLPVEKGNTVS
ncbi:MAG: rhodanese-like domain-containing protein [Thermodesulfobacteriota bacterium]|nr:rhodanese-like domain-containing protein [Thermodesulfobacteriota bacterium]